MKIFSSKKTALLALSLVIALSFGIMDTAFGAQVSKVIGIFVNGKQVNLQDKPQLINGRVYVPVRALSEILSKKVEWDSAAYSVRVTDKQDEAIDAKIKELENTIAQLKAQLAEKEMQYTILKAQYDALLEKSQKVPLCQMEKELNKKYGEYRDVEFGITLDGDEDDIEVIIAVDLDEFEDEWDSLSDSRKTTYLQNIVDELLKQYGGASIEGYIYDSSVKSKPKLVTFTVNSQNKVQLKSTVKLSDLEEDLDDEYYDYFRGITLSIELDGDADEIEYYIYVDLSKYDSNWKALSDSSIKKLMGYIYEDIEDEYEDADIRGYVIDSYSGDELAKYYLTSSGNEKFYRYY